jgi:N-acyl-L-homoserine lactone synthetase
MTLRVKLAETLEELDGLFRARHRVFAEEMGYTRRTVDGRLSDCFDAFPDNWNVIALIDGRVVGGVRLGRVTAVGTPLDTYFDFGPHLPKGDRVAVGSQIFVEAPHRAHPEILVAMMATFYRLVRSEGFRHVVGVSAPMAERHLLRSGYKALVPRFFHEEKRLSVLPVMLDLRDLRLRADLPETRPAGSPQGIVGPCPCPSVPFV